MRHIVNESVILFASVFAAVGLVAAIFIEPTPKYEQPQNEENMLIHCMNGRHISLGDGHELTCKIRKVRT